MKRARINNDVFPDKAFEPATSNAIGENNKSLDQKEAELRNTVTFKKKMPVDKIKSRSTHLWGPRQGSTNTTALWRSRHPEVVQKFI